MPERHSVFTVKHKPDGRLITREFLRPKLPKLGSLQTPCRKGSKKDTWCKAYIIDYKRDKHGKVVNDSETNMPIQIRKCVAMYSCNSTMPKHEQNPVQKALSFLHQNKNIAKKILVKNKIPKKSNDVEYGRWKHLIELLKQDPNMTKMPTYDEIFPE